MGEVNLSQVMDRNRSFVDRIIEESGEDIRQCYQCAKCTGGCPGAVQMDYPPNQIIRMLMLGMKEEVLKSKTIWVCMGCSTCTTRCIRDIDIAHIMDVLRQEAIKAGYVEHAMKVIHFNNTFLWTVQNFGRLYEVGMTALNNLKTGNLLKDMQYGLPMMQKGKASMLPHRLKGIKEIKNMYNKTLQGGN